MSKRCAKCKYKLEDMCRFWQMWRKDAPLIHCSEKVIQRCCDAGYLQYRAGGLGGGTQVLDPEGIVTIIKDEFKHLNLV